MNDIYWELGNYIYRHLRLNLPNSEIFKFILGKHYFDLIVKTQNSST